MPDRIEYCSKCKDETMHVVSGLYPKNGSRNILRKFSGKVLKKAKAENGWYITVQEAQDANKIRSFLMNKVVTGKVVLNDA